MAKGLQHAGQFHVDDLRLVTTTGLEIDLKTSVLGITLFEDINATTITGSISISDSANLVSHGPILGQEYLHLKIRTPYENEDESTTINFSENAFFVYAISKRQKFSDRIQGFVLSFASQELIKNQRLKVTQSLTGTWSDIVKKMLKEKKYLDTKKKVDLEPTAGIKKFVTPNMRPLDVVGLGMKQAVAEFKGEPTYLFYETLKGFNFRTLASLYNNNTIMEYTTLAPGTNIVPDGQPGAGSVDIFKDLSTILHYEIIPTNNSVISYRSGMFGSKLITHDIVSKSYTTKTYNYFDEFKNESHIISGVVEGKRDYPLMSNLAITEEGLRVSDFPARTFFMPTSTSGDADSQHQTENNTSPYMAYDPHKWAQRRNSQMIQLENALQLNMKVHGNTTVNVGDKVIVNIPYTAVPEGPNNEKFDKFYKGPFLIKTIRHDFFNGENPKHEMHLQLMKDSLEEELANTGPLEPSSSTKGKVEVYKYN